MELSLRIQQFERGFTRITSVTSFLPHTFILKTGLLGAVFRSWSFAFRYVTWIWNCLPRAATNISPYEYFRQRIPPLDKFRVFGAPGTFCLESDKKFHINDSHPRGFFLGFASHPNFYLMYCPSRQQVFASRTVSLDEGRDVSDVSENKLPSVHVELDFEFDSDDKNAKTYTPLSSKVPNEELSNDERSTATAERVRATRVAERTYAPRENEISADLSERHIIEGR